MPRAVLKTILRTATMAISLLLCVAPAAHGGNGGALRPRAYTDEHPLVYEDAWDLYPYVFLDDNGTPTGYNVELLRLLFDELGIPYEIRLKPTQQALDDLRNGETDLMLGMMADYHDDYTRHYGKNIIHLFTHSVAHPKNYANIVHNLYDLSTQQVIVHDGSFSHHLIERNGWGLNAQPFEDMNLAIQTVSAENSGQVLWNTMSLKWLLHKYHADNLTLSPVDIPSGEYHFMSHDSVLLARLDSAYTRLKSGERLQPLEMKWFYPENAAEHTTPAWLWYVAYLFGGLTLLMAVLIIIHHLRERRSTADSRLRINRLAMVLKICRVRIWTYDVKSQTISWYGDDARTQTVVAQKRFARRYWPAELDQLHAAVQRLINKEAETATLQMHINDPEAGDDTENHIYSVALSVLQSEEGAPTVIMGTELDTTEETGRQRKAAELTRRYRAVFSTAMVDMIYCDSEGYVANLNERAQHTFHATPDEARQRRWNAKDFFADGDILTYRHATHILTPGNAPLPDSTFSDTPGKAGHYLEGSRFYEMQVLPVFDAEQKPLGIYATGRDVTEVARTYNQAHEALKELRLAMDELGEYVNNINYVLQVGGVRIVTYSPETHVLTVFHRMHEVQYTLTQQRCIALAGEDSTAQVMRLMRAMDRRTKATLSGEIRTRLRGKDRQQVCLQVQMFPIFDDQGAITTYEGVCRDVSEMKHTEQMLQRETEKAQEVELLKSKFLHNMCYAIRTPLDTVVESAELFEKDHDPAEEPRAIETIKTHTAYLLNLVNDILFLSRLDAKMVEIKPRDCDITDAIEVFCNNGWNEGRFEGVSYEVEHTYEKLVVAIDDTNLGRIMEQLLHNAVAHTKKGRVRVRYDYLPGRLIIGIDDTGEGIPQEVLDHIFDRFNTPSGKTNSTGLGLPICQELAAQMGGHIDINSEVGKGTTVWVTLPCEAKTVVRK